MTRKLNLRERIARVAAREAEWRESEQIRKSSLEKILTEREKAAQELSTIETELQAIQEEMGSMNEEKAALVFRLKQASLVCV